MIIIVMAAVIGGWLLWPSRRVTGVELHPPNGAVAPRPERPQTLRLPAATISPIEAERDSSGFTGRVVSAETGQPIPHASLTFVVTGAAVTATGDDDGRFVVAGEAPGVYELVSATADGFLPFDAQLATGAIVVSTGRGVRVDDVTIYLTPAAKLAVTVQDPSGKPIAGAEVRILSWRGAASPEPVLTSDRGEAELVAESDQRLDVRKPGFVRSVTGFTRAMSRRRIVITLQPGQDAPLLAISGRAVDNAGAPVDGAVVEAYSVTPGVLRRSAVSLTGVDGRFTLTELGEDRYRVRATTPHQGSAELRNVAAGATGVELRLGPPDVGIRGTVRDEANRAVAAFAVVATPKDGPLVRGSPLRASVIDPLGHYFLALPAGSYAVSAAASGHAPSAEASVEVSDSVIDLDLTLPRGSRMFGRVVERGSGAPVAGAYVNLAISSATEGIALVNAAMSGTDGAFSFDGVRPGRTSITVHASGHNGRVLGGLDVPRDGPLGPLTVDLAKVPPGEEVVEFVGIAAQLEPAAAGLRLGATLPGGGASSAGLVTGDLILAVDGLAVQELGTSSAVEALRGPENTIVTLTVKRADGATSIVPVMRKHVELR